MLDGVLCVQCGHAGWLLHVTSSERLVLHEHEDLWPCQLASPAAVPGTRHNPGLGVRPCRSCSRDMISNHAYQSSPERRGHYRAHQGHGMCSACYKRAQIHGTLPDPAPRLKPVCTNRPRTAAAAERHAQGQVTA